jgi:lysophospholipase L1-like esterase
LIAIFRAARLAGYKSCLPTPVITKLTQSIRNVWLITGISIALFALLEGTCFFAWYLIDHRFTTSEPKIFDRRIQAEYYKNAPWAEDLFKELHESFSARWESYVYWRRKPYNGKHITINSDGLRVTPQFNDSTAKIAPQPKLRVFMFGGSALWGTGARDSFTIPALLGLELRSRKTNVEVVNFAESGYVSTQEVIELLLQLQKGNIPDVVIFYDGANDAVSAYYQKTPGLPQNEENRIDEFNLKKRVPEIRRILLAEVINNLATVRSVKALVARIKTRSHNREKGKDADYDTGPIAERAIDVYLKNVEIAGGTIEILQVQVFVLLATFDLWKTSIKRIRKI